MTISGVSGAGSLAALAAQAGRAPQQAQQAPQQYQGPSFSERMNGAIEQVADAQRTASESAKAYETGATDDLAAVMIDQQVSSLGFQMTLSVRNKALTAYRDIMNMPV
ncbi:flagellar hook-basal body complex protein FliE [Meridianimarinicoccus roseus]|jgi:flagellar hook-basal body complex protein FliE|uniref:Flagellar hook-basal body complex protein FliE n=1 Tax=Meridianimarinicoccus roseus TaxID=2072018 RepID=A0A2V2LB29_9RHOB|nr:flagellar hook-basal body complex protein FliE [Meridianimarinicoccus roseus]PWR02598.1 flagellar hook-basal body complex protein FliE [Meridianimarinicoccus roseus]